MMAPCASGILSQKRKSRDLPGHTDTVSSVAFSPDGTQILSGSHDHTLRLWDISWIARFQVGERDSERFRRIYTASFKMYPLRLEGFRLVDAPVRRYLTPVNGYRFPKQRVDQKYDRLRTQRLAGEDLVGWILECSAERK